MTDNRIAIVGGGIGGLTAAIALARHGARAVVFESAESLDEVGAGIWMPPNAMQVFDRLGICEAVVAEGMPVERLELRTREGTLLKALDLAGVTRRYGVPTVAIHRGRLQRVLARHAPADHLVTGRTCSRVEPADDAMRLLFEHGAEEEAQVVIGADGIHSRVRAFVAPDARLRDSGQVALRGLCRAGVPEDRRGVSGEYWGPKIRFGVSSIAPQETYWWCALDREPVDGERIEDDLAPSLDRLTELASAFPASVREVVAATDPSELILTPLLELAPLRRWWRGCAVLLGDAAHAMTPNLGQGGAQAVEDAYVLAQTLTARSTPGEQGSGDVWLARAFAAYQRTRRKRANAMARASRWIGALAHVRSPVGRRLRDLTLRLTPEWVDARQARALYDLTF